MHSVCDVLELPNVGMVKERIMEDDINSTDVIDHKAVAQIDESLEMFDFGGHNVRVVLQGGEPWFVLKDVCDVLEVKTFHVKPRLEEDDLGSTDTIDRLGRSQTVTTVNESGLYDVILDSRKPEAKKFRRWVTSEVLPSIRRDGGYIKGQENMTGEELMAKALQFADSRIKSLEAKVAADKPMVEFAEAVQGCASNFTGPRVLPACAGDCIVDVPANRYQR